MGLTSWPSLGPSEGPSYVLAMDVSHKPFPEKIQKRPAGNTFTHAPRFLSFWACSHMEMPSGGEVRCPKGQVKHRDDSKLPKATKTEESADSKEVKAVPLFSVFRFKSREVSLMHRMNHKIQHNKRAVRNAEGWRNRMKRWGGALHEASSSC